MRILNIKNNHAVIEVESTELDNILNNYLDLQYAIGYEEGFNDWKKIYEEEDDNNEQMVDDHRSEEEY